jgi:hypothetical protein
LPSESVCARLCPSSCRPDGDHSVFDVGFRCCFQLLKPLYEVCR